MANNGELSFEDAMATITNEDRYIQAARSQDIIGYDNFQFGRVSRHWRILQQSFLESHHSRRRYSAEAWSKRFIHQMYKRMKSIWKRRCEIVHGSKGRQISRREKKALKKEILPQYKLGKDGVRAGDRGLFEQTQSKVLHSRIKYQRYWIRTLKTSRTYMKEFESGMFGGMRTVMRNWALVLI